MIVEESVNLSVEDLLKICHKKSPEEVKKINAFAMSILTLPSNLGIFPNLQIISLSLNFLTTLQPFQACHQLQELHLRKNNIRNVNEIKYLKDLKKLSTFLLNDNPCCETTESYRLKVIRILKNLKSLDSVVISEDERVEANDETNLELMHFERRLEEELTGGEEGNHKEDATRNEIDSEKFDESDVLDEGQKKIVSEVGEGEDLCGVEVAGEEIGEEKIDLEFGDLNVVTPLPPSDGLPLRGEVSSGELQTYSNTLLATKLLLLDMSTDEVRQVMAWCQEKLSTE
jgi:hypothetical protein